jgi:hypothetical protein
MKGSEAPSIGNPELKNVQVQVLLLAPFFRSNRVEPQK